MTVDAMQHDIAVIDVKQTVANVDIAESDALRHNLKDVAAGISQGHYQMIEIRRFRRPLLWCADLEIERGAGEFIHRQSVNHAAMQRLLTVKQSVFERCHRWRGGDVFQHDVAGEGGIAIVIIEIGTNGKILDMGRLFADQIDVAENSRRPPHILVFNVGGISPLHDANAQQVVTGFHHRADIKLGRQATAFAEANVLTIHVNFEVGFYAIKFNQRLFALPAFAERENTLVGSGGVIGRHVGDINRERKTFVGILQLAVPFHLPHTGDGDVAPVAHKLRRKGFRHLQRMLKELEIPLTAQQLKEAAGFAGKRASLRNGVVREKICAWRQSIFVGELNVFPAIHKASRWRKIGTIHFNGE